MKPAIVAGVILTISITGGDLKELRSLDAIVAPPRREAIKRRLPKNVSQEE